MIYANLRAEMTRNAISLAAMAELLGMSSRNLNFKLNGSINFSVKEAQKIRDHFFPNLSLDYLFERVEKPKTT